MKTQFIEDARYITVTVLTAPIERAPEVTVSFDCDGAGEVTISDPGFGAGIIVDAGHLEVLHQMLGRALELRRQSILDPSAAS